MKFKCLNGQEIGVDIRPSKWPRKDEDSCKSHFQWRVGQVIDSVFPGEVVLEEFYAPRQGFYIDFFLPRRMIAVEADGRQHDVFNVYFHGNKENFLKAQARDAKKNEWCELNGIKLIRVSPDQEEDLESMLRF
jgi:hypothetical protein